MNLYIKIKTGYKEFIKLLLLYAIFIDSQYFYLRSYNSNTVHMSRLYVGLIGVISLLYFNHKEEFRNIMRKYKYINIYLLYVLAIIIIHSLYGISSYGENLFDVIWASTHFILLFLVPIFIFLFENNLEKYFKIVMILGVISTLLTLTVALCGQFGIPIILPGIGELSARNGHVRIGVSNIGRISIIYIFDRILVEERKMRKFQMTILWLLMLVAYIYFQATRMASIGLIAAYIIMLLFYRENKNKKIIYALVVLFAVVALLINSNMIFESFSVEGDLGGSTIARLLGIEYFKEIFYSHPFMGMGLIRPSTEMLKAIWSGPYGIFYIDDLGILGGLFETGLTGIVVYVIPLIRMVYISFVLLRNKDKHAVFVVGMTICTLITQGSLSLLSQQRAIGTILIWSLFEVMYCKSKNIDMLLGELGNENGEN